ncbi:hypothetical protein JW930_04655 [Candidatus Woesearchaeota archaeon]|nr:hypothetical protein [Candidatus Woesearchaeota archaeon]
MNLEKIAQEATKHQDIFKQPKDEFNLGKIKGKIEEINKLEGDDKEKERVVFIKAHEEYQETLGATLEAKMYNNLNEGKENKLETLGKIVERFQKNGIFKGSDKRLKGYQADDYIGLIFGLLRFGVEWYNSAAQELSSGENTKAREALAVLKEVYITPAAAIAKAEPKQLMDQLRELVKTGQLDEGSAYNPTANVWNLMKHFIITGHATRTLNEILEEITGNGDLHEAQQLREYLLKDPEVQSYLEASNKKIDEGKYAQTHPAIAAGRYLQGPPNFAQTFEKRETEKVPYQDAA